LFKVKFQNMNRMNPLFLKAFLPPSKNHANHCQIKLYRKPNIEVKSQTATRKHLFKTKSYFIYGEKIMDMKQRSNHATPQELIELLPHIHYFKWDKVSKDLIEDYAKPNAFERDGLLFISSEDTLNADLFVYDTYGEVRPTEPIHPTLIQWAEQLGTYWEQYDNASIVLNPDDIKPTLFRVIRAQNDKFRKHEVTL
jgi:hypothetical protein